MSRSTSRAAALGGCALLVLALAPPVHADDNGGGGSVAEMNPNPVAEAPIVELNTPVEEMSAPVRDLVTSTENEDGSLTDAEGSDERTVTLDADVLFDFDESDLTSDAEEVLAEAAEIVESDAPGQTVRIDGYTDDVGEEDYNQDLSEDRAEAVHTYLEDQLDDSDFTVEGHGASDPVAPNEIDGEDNPDGREQNRRVELSFDT